ncbi:MAG: Secretion system C-terminal sorting domain [Bacteroidota bacterium]|jgi:hypothetical protein
MTMKDLMLTRFPCSISSAAADPFSIEKGDAVYKARAMHAYYEPYLQYDDLFLCAASGTQNKTSGPNAFSQILSGLNDHTVIDSTIGTLNANLTCSISPNPTKDVLNIDFSAKLTSGAQVQVFAVDGRCLITQKLALGSSSTSIQLRHLAVGSYFVKVDYNNDKIFVAKISKL